jgi:hypothetical protein
MPVTPVYNRAAAITKSDTVDIPEGLTDAVYIGGAGVTVFVFEDDSTVTMTCTAGQLLPLRVKRINSSVTASTLWVALYQV